MVNEIYEMTKVKSTADAHRLRDSRGGGEWICDCHVCESYRSLMGMDKVLNIRPIVRELQWVEDQLGALPEGPEKNLLRAQFADLYDRLAQVMER